jgi:uncharacterized repeat protein (TIGR03803 family)
MILLTTLAMLAEAIASTAWPRGSTYTVLYTFGNQIGDGAGPAIYLHDKAGNLYGSTFSGGTNDAGNIFKLAPDGNETILYPFCSRKNCGDGNGPHGALVMDKKGNVYGTTETGGKYDNGAVFEVRQTGSEKVLYSFTGGSDGSDPIGGLLRDGGGNLYGTTIGGGESAYCCGVVFKLVADGTYTVLHSFTDGDDGAGPESPMIIDNQGNLYGTTFSGGTGDFGTVFEIAPNGAEIILYSFTNGSDGGQPLSGLTMDLSGNLFGLTFGGGNSGCFADIGCGVVFKLAPDGTETTLYAFHGGSDGGNPWGTLIADGNGDLFGTATDGARSGCYEGYGCGTVFKISPDDREKVLYAFSGEADGGNPGGVIWDPVIQKGTLYGGASVAGEYGDGVAFSLAK